MDSTIVTAIVTPIIRHGATFVGGWLVSHGVLEVAQTGSFTTLATGIAVAGIGLGWSFVKNRMAKK